MSGEQLPLSFTIYPDTDPLEPRVLRRFAPQAELYVAHAQSAMRLLGGEESKYGGVDERWEKYVQGTKPLLDVGKAGRGLSPAFYDTISEQYKLLVEQGEPHPIKTLAEAHSVTMSAASRWVKEARRIGKLPPKERRRS